MNDPLTDRWIATWAAMRSLRITQIDGWPLVHVGSQTRRTELICVDPGIDAFCGLLPHVAGDAEAMVTVVGHDLAAYRALPPPRGVRVDRDDETLMTASLAPVVELAVPPGLSGTFETVGGRVTYRLDDGERIAAEATMGIDDGWATFDQVETLPSHRRRGLGRHVMSTMCARAVDEGATRGILAASPDGRALYESLGWTAERELLSWMGA